jgi:macrolide transport system ATP-binding/permease protein
VHTLLQDIRYGIRMLLKSRMVSLIAILTLAMGIGVNTAIFSTMNALFLRPLPVQNADHLLYLAAQQQNASFYTPVSYLDLQDIRAQAGVFSDVLAYNIDVVGLNADGKATPIFISFVTGNYFQALGLKPALGRLIYGEEAEKPTAESGIVLGYSYWKTRFNGDPGVIGKQVKVNGHAATIVGVAPEGFHGLYSLGEMQAYLPFGMEIIGQDSTELWSRRDNRSLLVLGMLKPGFTLQQAQSSVDLIAKHLAQQSPAADNGLALRLYPERMARPQPVPGNGLLVIGFLFSVLAGLVLLLACTNVANILLVRSTSRESEMAIRAALGGSRTRLIRQLLTESLVLAFLGGAGGLVLGIWASKYLSSIPLAAPIPVRFDFSFDWRVFSYGLIAAFVTGIVMGFAPAWRVSRANINGVLHQGSRGVVASGGSSRMRSALVIIQITGSLMLLVAAGLFVRSSQNAQHVYLGLDPNHILNLNMDTKSVGFDKSQTQRFYRDLVDQVRTLPGVQSVSMAYSVPMGYYGNSGPVYAEGQYVASKQAAPDIMFNNVDPAYFSTLRIPMVKGRSFTDDDNDKTPLVAIVNETMAKQFWPNQEAVGKRFSVQSPSGPFIQVVGVSKSGKYLVLFEGPTPYYYVPQMQNATTLRMLQIRTAVAPESLITAVEQQIHTLAPDLPVMSAQTMNQALAGGNGLFLFRLGARFTGALGLLGLILAVVGVYGVISYVASQRTHEIGLRMALGANRIDVLRLILKQGLYLVGAGIATGVLLILVGARALSSLPLGVSAADPVTLVLVSCLLAAVGLAASMIPARRAMRTEPLTALKYE